MKEGYKPFVLVNGFPRFVLTPNGVTFSKSAVVKLGCPAIVNFFISERDKILLLKPAHNDDQYAIPFYRENDRSTMSVRINNQDLMNYLCHVNGWDRTKYKYSVDGKVDYKDGTIEFDMFRAEKTLLQKR